MQQAKHQRGHLGIWLEAKPALKRAKVVERLVHHRETDDGVNHVRANADFGEYAQ
ncbi:hypothetical protein D3C80_1906450 [compost metagenome]